MTNLVLMRIAPFPAARVLAVLYMIIGALLMPFLLLAALVSPQEATAGRSIAVIVSFMLPFIYAFVGFFIGLIGGYLYNLVARLMGGIPVSFSAEGSS